MSKMKPMSIAVGANTMRKKRISITASLPDQYTSALNVSPESVASDPADKQLVDQLPPLGLRVVRSLHAGPEVVDVPEDIRVESAELLLNERCHVVLLAPLSYPNLPTSSREVISLRGG
jgi:hypothetical protein